MKDLNWKTWALIALVAMGVMFEGLKRLPRSAVDAAGLKFDAAQTQPYQVKYKRARNAPAMLAPPMMKPLPAHTAGLAQVNRETIEKFMEANKAHTSDFKHPGDDKKAAAKKKSKPLKEDEEWEVVVDPKTGKKMKRRRKKIAKVEQVAPEPYKEEKKEEPKKEEDVDHVISEAIAGGGLPPVGGKNDTPHADLEEWKRRLLARPDAAETRRFIEHYNNGLVSAEIFYKIVALMLDDSRPQMKELGVLCAGLTPSVLSFGVLVDVLKEERSGSSLRKYSESFLAQYASVGRLLILGRIMRAPSSPTVAIVALKRFEDTANLMLDPKKNKPPKNPTPATAGKHSNSGYFTAYVAPLTALTKNSDAQVKDQAKITLNTLNNLMNMSNAPATAAPPTQASAQ